MKKRLMASILTVVMLLTMLPVSALADGADTEPVEGVVTAHKDLVRDESSAPIVDEYGTIYFKNDSAYLMAFGSAIETIEVTAMPDKIVYAEGETFDPAGMVVTATYANGMTRDITAYVSYGTEPLTAEDARFTISFDLVMYHNEETDTAMNAGVPTVTPTAVLELTIGTTALGDVNGDGSVDAADAQMILDHEARNTEGELPLETADVSGDGVIDSNDAVLILQYAKNLISAFPAAAEAASEP